MIRVNNLHIPINYDDNTIKNKVCRELRIDKGAVKSVSLFRRSIDARKKDNIYFLCSIDVELNISENAVLKKAKNAVAVKPYEYNVDKWNGGASPVVVGMGPAGLFAALILAQSGAKPIVLERGKDVDSRTDDVNKFWTDGKLNVKSNVQFGEGGAGTFSDGKLNTGTKDSRQRKVLEEFVNHGAPEEILYNAKPHIGTDKLKITVKKIREEIISLGGTVVFEAQMTDFFTKDGKISAVEYEKDGKKERIDTDNVILAVGHSARDTFELLNDKNLPIEAKPFSIGARIEHRREAIDKSQYGKFAGNRNLGAASYKMNVRTKNGRGAYTFCMCPGGKVVNASSEDGMLCTNGMSEFARNGINSNSALLVGITPDDFGSSEPLAGVELQRKLEKKAFELGGGNYNAPVQRAADFMINKRTVSFGSVVPSYTAGVTMANISECLPEYVTVALKEGIVRLGSRLSGFSDGDAILTAVETRSSSPVRILRDSILESVAVKGLYPCGEGAGYAGGIMSAAVDGIKCAELIAEKAVL